MKPRINLAEAHSPDGSRLTLHSHDGTFGIRVNGKELMHSTANASELQLGEISAARFTKDAAPRILIGGLGLGFTLRSVLENVGSAAEIHVAELIPEVVEWNKTHMRDLNGKLLDDPRVKIFVEDICALIRRTNTGFYDVIILDIDNGPTAMVQTGNAKLYDWHGIQRLSATLKPAGSLTIWSAAPAPKFSARLTRSGFRVHSIPAKLYPNARRAVYTIYVADKAPATPPATAPLFS